MTEMPDHGRAPDNESRPATPRWVKVFGIVTLVIVVLVVLLLVVGGGSHGPGRHTGTGGEQPHASLAPSAGIHAPG
jgi:hypothetical protein